MITPTKPVVELKRQERSTYYLVLETLTTLVNAGNFVDAMIVLEAFRIQRDWNDWGYDQFKHYLTSYVDFAEVSSSG